MKSVMIPAALAAVLLAACVREEVTEVTIVDVPAETLEAATGMPGTAIVTGSRAGNEYVLVYREAEVTAEQVAAAPGRICAYEDKSVFASHEDAMPEYQITEGLSQMTVTCG